MATELKKSINIFQGVGIAVGMVIGSGLLGLPGLVIDTGGVTSSSIGWVLISLLCIPLIFIFSRLGLEYPSSAGLSSYSKVAVGEWAESGVSIVLIGTFIVCIPVGTTIGATYLKQLFSIDIPVFWIAISILAIITILNIIGIHVSSMINIFSIIALFFLVSYIVFINHKYVYTGAQVFSNSILGKSQIQLFSIWNVCAMLFWAYLGWENLSFGLEEFKNPRKNIPLVFWLSYIIVILFYCSLAFVSIGSEFSGNHIRGAAGLTNLINQSWATIFINIAMIFIVFANVNSWVFGASRLVFSAGRQGILPKFIANLSAKGVPYISLIALFLAYSIITLIFLRNEVFLSKMLVLANQNFIVLYAFCIIAYWKTEKTKIKYIITILSIISCSFLLSGFRLTLIYPLLLLLTGYLIYERNRRKKAILNIDL